MSRFSRADGLIAGRTRKVIVAIAVLALVAIPISNVVASHQFSDVPTSSGYHPSISAIANAGITSGCSATKYCPKNYVTREQMAVFLNRLGNLDGETGPIVDALTVAGELIINDIETFTLTGTLGDTACRTSTLTVPQFSEIPYVVTTQLYDAPATTSLINTSVDDPDPEDGEFDVCFTSITGTLLTGDYKTAPTLTLFLGSGLFASARASSAATRFLESRMR